MVKNMREIQYFEVNVKFLCGSKKFDAFSFDESLLSFGPCGEFFFPIWATR
jgi:hypothetical protein